MANEATQVLHKNNAVSYIVADGSAITKGSVLKMTDPMTAALSDGDNDVVAGIAMVDKIASDGVTSLAVFDEGIFRMKLSGAVSVGEAVSTDSSSSGSNFIKRAPNGLSGAKILGNALETGATGEEILVKLNIGGSN